MLKNLKHSILFILMAITILLVVIMSLAASKPVPSINAAAISAQKENNLKYGKWSGLGMGISSTTNTADFDSYVDILLANGFEEIRTDGQTWNAPAAVNRTKAAAIRATAKGAKVVWGTGQWDGAFHGYPEYPPITAANWAAYRQAVLDAATWAQANGIYEFQIGNEEESEIDGITMTVAQLIINLKSLATEVQAIYTIGNVSYSCLQSKIANWATAGRGDIDIIASNIYKGGAGEAYDLSYQGRIDALITAFGAEHTYLTEFAPSYTSLANYSADEAVQAAAVTEMIDYIKTSGMTRALYFCWGAAGSGTSGGGVYGVLKEEGTYRSNILSSLINKNE